VLVAAVLVAVLLTQVLALLVAAAAAVLEALPRRLQQGLTSAHQEPLLSEPVVRRAQLGPTPAVVAGQQA
jgi:hypothetical protein